MQSNSKIFTYCFRKPGINIVIIKNNNSLQTKPTVRKKNINILCSLSLKPLLTVLTSLI